MFSVTSIPILVVQSQSNAVLSILFNAVMARFPYAALITVIFIVVKQIRASVLKYVVDQVAVKQDHKHV